MTDSRAIDAAIVGLLLNDAPLMALCPDGVYFDVAAQNAQRAIIVSLVPGTIDEQQFGARAFESAVYLVKAIVLSKSGADAAAAAARIDTLLDQVTLTPTGYAWAYVYRDGRLKSAEPDDVDPSIRWQHHGGQYRVIAAP